MRKVADIEVEKAKKKLQLSVLRDEIHILQRDLDSVLHSKVKAVIKNMIKAKQLKQERLLSELKEIEEKEK